jgi:hypothetical protein
MTSRASTATSQQSKLTTTGTSVSQLTSGTDQTSAQSEDESEEDLPAPKTPQKQKWGLSLFSGSTKKPNKELDNTFHADSAASKKPSGTSKMDEHINPPTRPPIEKAVLSKPLTKATPITQNPAVDKNKNTDKNEPLPSTPEGTKRCEHCSRPFNVDRLEKHEAICLKAKLSREARGNFDSSKMRIKGTEVEQLKSHVSSKSRAKSAPPVKAKTSNWRKTHEEFIKSLKEAKKIQAHLAKGGKLSD